MKLFLVVIYGDVEPSVLDEYSSDDQRVRAARNYRKRHGDRDGLYRLNIDKRGTPEMEPFRSTEIDE